MRKLMVVAVASVVVGSLLPVAMSPVGTVSAACSATHVLKKGQSAWAVAAIVKKSSQSKKSTGAIAKELQKLNPKASAWGAGKKICLPAWATSTTSSSSAAALPQASGATPATPADCSTTHVLKKGQSAWAVALIVKKSTKSAKSTGAISKELQKLNPKASAWGAGRKICLPGWAAASAAPAPSAPSQAAVSADESSRIIREVFGAFAATARGVPAEYVEMLPWVAVRIAWHESKLNNRNVNRSGCCVGLFQINYSAHSKWLKSSLGVNSKEDIKDPTKNSRAALRLFTGRSSSGRPGAWCAWDKVVRERAWNDLRANASPYDWVDEDPATGAIDEAMAARNKRILGLSC